MIDNIKTLLNSSLVSNYRISQVTGIAQSTLSDFTNGKVKIENMRLKHALKLKDLYIKNKEMFEMEKEIRKLFKDAKDVEENVGWEVYEVGAYLKDKKVNFYVGYTGQGIDENVYNKAYDDIVYLTDYYNDYADGHHELSDVVELSLDLINKMKEG